MTPSPRDVRIPLLDKKAGGEFRRVSRVYQGVIWHLDDANRPITAYSMAKLLIREGRVYTTNRKPRNILTMIKKVLADLVETKMVESIEIVAAKYGNQKAYSLSPVGKMVAAVLLPYAGMPISHGNQEKAVRDYLLKICKKNDPLRDFAFDIMLEMQATGYSEPVKRYFILVAMDICENRIWRLFNSAIQNSNLNQAFQPMTLDERRAHAKAFLKTFRSLSEERKQIIRLRIKSERETAYLFREPDQKLVDAIVMGGEKINTPLWCNHCKTLSISRQSVEEIYEGKISDKRRTCPMCGAPAEEPDVNNPLSI